MNTTSAPRRNHGRRVLLAIALLFFGTFILAGLLRLADIHPAVSKQRGELLQPPADLRDAAPRLAAGGRLASGEFTPDASGVQWCDAEVLRLLRRRSLAALRKGHAMLLDDGKVRLVVEEASPDRAITRVVVGGRMSDRKGVEIDYCPKCRGVWLDRGELDKIIDRAAPAPGPQPARADYGDRREDYRQDYRQGGKPYRKKREGFLGDLFDF